MPGLLNHCQCWWPCGGLAGPPPHLFPRRLPEDSSLVPSQCEGPGVRNRGDASRKSEGTSCYWARVAPASMQEWGDWSPTTLCHPGPEVALPHFIKKAPNLPCAGHTRWTKQTGRLPPWSFRSDSYVSTQVKFQLVGGALKEQQCALKKYSNKLLDSGVPPSEGETSEWSLRFSLAMLDRGTVCAEGELCRRWPVWPE